MKLLVLLICTVAIAAAANPTEDRHHEKYNRHGFFFKHWPFKFGKRGRGGRGHSHSSSSSSSSEEDSGPAPNVDLFLQHIGVTASQYTAVLNVYLNDVPDEYKQQFTGMINIIQSLVQNYWENWDDMAPLRPLINPEIHFTINRLREFTLTLSGNNLDGMCMDLPNGDNRLEVLSLFKTLRQWLIQGLSLFVEEINGLFEKLEFIASKDAETGKSLRNKLIRLVFENKKDSAAIFQLVGGYLNTVGQIMADLQSPQPSADPWAPLQPIKELFDNFWDKRLKQAARHAGKIVEVYTGLQEA